MSPQHPVRDGILAVALGGVLALGLILGVRAVQLATGPRSAPAPAATPAGSTPSADACVRQETGGGGGRAPDPTPGPAFPRQQHDLDTGRPIHVTGTTSAEIGYHRLGDFATVVDFECPDCQGNLSVFNTGSELPIVSGELAGEPVSVQWLIDTVHEESTGPDNSLLVRAEGNWSLTLRSWHDLPVQSGRYLGRGSQVVRMPVPRLRISFAPLNSRDSLNVYAYRISDREFRANACIGRFESQMFDLNGGDVLLIWARGEWTLQPV